MKQLTAAALSDLLAETSSAPVLLDVREPWEFALCRLPGSFNIPMSELPARLTELDEDSEIVMVCHHGMRSYQCGVFLEQQGFGEIINLTGGVAAWAEQVDPSMTRY